MCRYALAAMFIILFTLAADGPSAYAQIRAGAAIPCTEDHLAADLEAMATSGDDAWATGGPWGGYVNSLAMSSTDPDIIYAGTETGVLKSTDAGATWEETAFPHNRVGVLQVAPDDPDVVYAGSDDGLHKSEDGGTVWIQKGFAGIEVDALAIDPVNPQILYAGVNDYPSVVGVFKSTDGGETWHEKLTSGLQRAKALLIDADNPSHIYAGVASEGSSHIYFYRSPDAGETWVGSEFQAVSGEGGVALAMTPGGSDPPSLYLVIAGEDVYKSQDRGESWTPAGTPWISSAPPWAIAVDPNDAEVVYVGTWYAEGNLYKSTDGGDTWPVKAHGLPSGGPSSIAIDPRDSKVLVGLSEGGVYLSTDGAENWLDSSQGMNKTSVQGLGIHPSSSHTLLAGIKGEGHYLAITSDGGGSWDSIATLPVGNLGAVAFDPQNPSIIWAGDGPDWLYSVYIYKSLDGGQTWTEDWFNYCFGGCPTGVTDILVNPGNSDAVLIATGNFGGELVRTLDGGQTWHSIGDIADALAADPNDSDVVYSGKQQIGEVFRYTDVWGTLPTMNEITPAQGIGDVRDIEVNSDSSVYVAASDGLWKWDSSNWTTLGSLPTDDLTALAIDRSGSPAILYVGTSTHGILRSEDGGSTWTAFNEGLGDLSITRLAISAGKSRMIYAGTNYGGVWSRSIGASHLIYLPLILRNAP